MCRIYLQDQLNYAKKTNPDSIKFQRKFAIIQQKIVAKHATWLFILCASLSVCLILLMFVIYQLTGDTQEAMKRVTKAEEEMVTMTQQQEDVLNQTVIQPYPQRGLGIADYNWEKVLEEKDEERQTEIEGRLSQALTPYFGSTTSLMMLEVSSQEVTLAFASHSIANHNKKLVLENLTAFVTEAEEISTLTQVNFQLTFKNGTDQEEYHCSYQRDNGDAKFQLVSKENEEKGE